jgi:hypothetical protein
MADIESNIDDIDRWLNEAIASVDFTRPGSEGSLGEDITHIVARGIIDRTAAEQKASDGSPLKALDPRYKARKQAKYQVDLILVRTGQMMSLQSVLGETSISADSIEMRYGTGEAPQTSSTGYISDQDKAVTDREKAEHTSAERPFYGLDDQISDAIMDHARDWLDNEIG